MSEGILEGIFPPQLRAAVHPETLMHPRWVHAPVQKTENFSEYQSLTGKTEARFRL